MNANERYIYSLEEQLEKAKAEIKELQQSRQAAVSGSVCPHENQKLVETCVFCIDCKEFLGGAA